MRKSHSSTPLLDISIRGDELEQDRIQLERNLQHTEISFRLSSADGEDRDDYDPSVEYPRHNSAPEHFPDFASFDMRSRDHFDDDARSPVHPWSYRSGEDDEGINPFGGAETLSTAAHHASALTISAGLGGGRGARRDVSLSGAEYDPDRPLREMLDGVDSHFSGFDLDPSRSKYPGVGSRTFDPLAVDSIAELDRVLQSGHAPPPNHSRSVRIRSPASSVAASDSERPQSARPKLSDALRHVSFSPKRPRSAQSNRSPSPVQQPQLRQTHQVPPSPLAQAASRAAANAADTSDAYNFPTPKASSRRTNIFPSYTSSPGVQPEVRLHPPTPSSTSSKFTKMARGITREIQEEQKPQFAEKSHHRQQQPRSHVSTDNHSFFDERTGGGSKMRSTPRKGALRDNHNNQSSMSASRVRVYLPDVTGLTSAVESPAKIGTQYYVYRPDNGPRDSEARLLKTLSAVQQKLHHLEEENSISRRRVRELERELDVCKEEVARERTRMLQREDIIVRHQLAPDVSRRSASGSKGKGKARARDISINVDMTERYREAVEEKKALEALITTLRSHLTRLTSELSSHQALLTELRKLRESDVRALKSKSDEVDKLRVEVERLAGEVEVLRGVVEEGLKERRSAREEVALQESDAADLGMSEDMDVEEDEDLRHDEGDNHPQAHEPQTHVGHHSESSESSEDEDGDVSQTEEDSESEPFDPMSIMGSSRAEPGVADRTTRTDHATLGSSKFVSATTSGQFNSQVLEQVTAEIEERRSERSNMSRNSMHSRSPSPCPSPTLKGKRAGIDDLTILQHPQQREPPQREQEQQNAEEPHRVSSPALRPRAGARTEHHQSQQPQHTDQTAHNISRPSAPTPGHAARRNARHSQNAALETPFPQIRGEHLEKLFFSAPEHNAKTCTVCHRREPNGAGKKTAAAASWLPSEREKAYRGQGSYAQEEDESEDEGDREEAENYDDGDDDDEGFVEGSDELAGGRNRKGKNRAMGTGNTVEDFMQRPGAIGAAAKREGLPPQTVVARVVRELEDDFTHYKSIYCELADQYKIMDAVSDVPRRNILAQHLKEVVDILEQKGDQIASLYSLLTFKDKPVAPPPDQPPSGSGNRPSAAAPTAGPSSWGRAGAVPRTVSNAATYASGRL